MAERRMFAKTIIDSDAFLEMPATTQMLYFHLSMRADDEGFINNPKRIQKMVGASDDDLKILLAKNFVLGFESGIIVIKHWKIHNYIRADRLANTKYQEERMMLDIKENGAYTFKDDFLELDDDLKASEKRKLAYRVSDLPYSFAYKIKRAFEGKKCPLCGVTMTSSYKNCTPTVQHNIPISKGGQHELDNISVVCLSCNTSVRDKETEELNNKDVMDIWDKIMYAEKNNIDWFWNSNVLDEIDMSVKCQSNVSVGKVRLGKDSLDKDDSTKTKRFVPPTLEEVKAYCKERNNNVNPNRFINYYESNGWRVGRNKMIDWKASVRNWETNETKKEDKMPTYDASQNREYSEEYIKELLALRDKE